MDHNYNQKAKYASNKKSIIITSNDGETYNTKPRLSSLKTDKMDSLIKLIKQGYVKTRKSPKSSAGVEISLTSEGREILKLLQSMKNPKDSK